MRASASGADDGTPPRHSGDERSEMTPRSKKRCGMLMPRASYQMQAATSERNPSQLLLAMTLKGMDHAFFI